MASAGGIVLGKVANCVSKIILRDSVNISKVLTCYQPVRYRRRSNSSPSWHRKQKAYELNDSLTEENQEFIQQLVLDEYRDRPSPLRDEPWPKHQWKFNTKRTGVLAMKLGTIPQWLKNGTLVYTTLLQVLDNHVIRYTPPEKYMKEVGWRPWYRQKYGSVVVGALSCDPNQFSKEYNSLFNESGVPPKRKITRFLVTPDAAIQPGTPLSALHFRVGDYVDCSAKSVDYGFQGGVKRWGFRGMGMSHGGGKARRKIGATGGGCDKRGVWPGKRMPGHMGGDWCKSIGLKIYRINTKYNVLYLRSKSVPGPNHSYVRVYDTCLRNRRGDLLTSGNPPHMPTYIPDTDENIPEEYFSEDLFQFNEPSIIYEEEEQTK